MSEMTILPKMPIILTKDADWEATTVATSGAIILLPEDAVLVEAE